MEREFTEESDNENNIQEQFKNYKSQADFVNKINSTKNANMKPSSIKDEVFLYTERNPNSA